MTDKIFALAMIVLFIVAVVVGPWAAARMGGWYDR